MTSVTQITRPNRNETAMLRTCQTCRQSIFEPRVQMDNRKLHERLRETWGTSDRSSFESDKFSIADDLASYSDEILKLQVRIARLTRSREKLEQYEKKALSLQSPIRQLPNEVLSQIFHEVVAPLSDEEQSSDSPAKAFILSAVCAHWRGLAQSYPRLWSSITISDVWQHRLNGCTTGRQQLLLVDLLRMLIQRSQQHPLDIMIEARFNWIGAGNPAIQELFRHAYRWRKLSFHTELFHDVTFTLFQGVSFPMLEDVHVDHYIRHPVLQVFERAPSLRRLAYLTNANEENTPDPRFPWARLQHLEYFADGGLLPRILAMSTALTSLSLVFIGDGFSLLNPLGSLLLPSLSSLKVITRVRDREEATDRSFLYTLMSSLDLPALKDLTFRRFWPPECAVWPSEAMHAFLTRSNCRLTSLSLYQIGIADAQLVEFLKRVPDLKSLTLSQQSAVDRDGSDLAGVFTKAFTDSLHAYRRDSDLYVLVDPIVPKLTTLALNAWEVVDDFDHSSFISMVESRWVPDSGDARNAGVACLRSVELSLCQNPVDKAAYLPLLLLEREGLNISLKGEEAEELD